MTQKTIQIILSDGDPQGIRSAQITTGIVKVIEVPRSLLDQFLKMPGIPESGEVALYFLVAGSDEDAEPKVYIGQTSDLRLRLSTHNKEKDFWQRALVLIPLTEIPTQTHALFLEWYCLQQCKAAGRYVTENGNSGSRPHTPAPLEADCYEIYEAGRTLLTTLGYPIFDPIVKTRTASKSDEIFYCNSSDADGRGLYTQEGFVILKGSFGRKQNAPHMKGTASERFRQKLVESGILQEQGDILIFVKDHLFKSPSMAAVTLKGGSSNGWIDWKSKDGKTLDELKRQTAVEND